MKFVENPFYLSRIAEKPSPWQNYFLMMPVITSAFFIFCEFVGAR